MGARLASKPGTKPRSSAVYLVLLLVTVVLLAKLGSRPGTAVGSWEASVPQLSQALRTAVQAQPQQSSITEALPRSPPEWDVNVIFNGKGAPLDACSPNQAWPPGTWLQAPREQAQNSGRASSWLPGRKGSMGQGSADAVAPASRAGAQLPLTWLAQQMIWRHQNPADCSKAKFLLYRGTPILKGKQSHGIGSMLHLQTLAMLMAFNMGRIMVELPGTYVTEDAYCGDRQTMDTCYFEPLSHCKVTAEEAAAARYINATLDEDREAILTDRAASLPRFVAMDRELLVSKNPFVHTVPNMFAPFMAQTGVPSHNAYYWWRGQSIAYIMRPNADTLAQLRQRRAEKLLGGELQPGCVSLYIRHGDKGNEHKTNTDEEYDAALQQLLKVDPNLSRQVFLSTEDPDTVAYFTAPERNYTTPYVQMPRKPDRKKANVVYMREHGFANEMLDGLLNLDLALECDGFVSNINSNWARLIDELRDTVRCKADKPYMDVQIRAPKGVFFWW